MGEYWNLFLNWLDSVGQRYANYQDQTYMNKQKLYPVAPKAEDRYANSRYEPGYTMGFPMGNPSEEIVQEKKRNGVFDEKKGAKIYRYVKDPGDTVYVEESPQYDMLGGLLYGRSIRKASTKRPRGTEYETLKRRWNIAKKLAKQ